MTNFRPYPFLSTKIQSLTFIIASLLLTSANAAQSLNDFDGWKKNLKIELSDRGLPNEIVNLAINNASNTFAPSNTDSKRTYSENTPQQLVENGFIQKAALFRSENNTLISQIARKYKISEHFILTLWGLETGFNQDAHPNITAIESLVYRVYQNKRDYQSKQELIGILKSIDQGGTELSQLQSKSDGTIGQLSLQPSMYRQYAVDQDEDGEIDVWNSIPDSIASAANVLSHNGWKQGEPWGYEIKLPIDTDPSVIGLTRQVSIETLKSYGATMIDDQEIPESGVLASIIQPQGSLGPSYLVFNNFFSLLRWHRSADFALAFGLLADKLDQSGTMDANLPIANAFETN